MAFNGSGVFTRLYNWVSDAAAGIPITPSRVDGDANDFATGLTNCITRNGQSPATANIPMGGYKITGLAAGVSPSDAANVGQLSLFNVLRGNGVTDMSAALFAANAAGIPIQIVGVLVIGTPTTVTVPIVDTLTQLFTPTSLVTIDNGLPVRPEWFGPVAGLGGNVNGMVRYAVNALPAKGGTVKLVNAAYRSGYDTATAAMFNNRGGTPGTDYMVKQHVSIVGDKLGEFNGALTQMQNGSIIQGAFYISSECTGFRADLFSVDVGSNVVTAFYGGAPGVGSDGFCILQCNKTTPAYGVDYHIGTLSALGSGANTLGHAFLFEAISGDLKYVEAQNSWHGIALKTNNFYADTLVGKFCYSENVIFKSDAYAVLGVLSVGKVICQGATSGSVAGDYGLMMQAATASGGGITVGNLSVDNTNFGVRLTAIGAFTLADVSIGSVTVRGCTYGYDIVADIRRTQIGSLKINAATQGGITIYPAVTSPAHYVGSLSMANVAVAGITNASSTGGSIRIGSVMVDGVTGTLFSYSNASAEIMIEGVVAGAGTNGAYSNITPSLVNSWVNQGGVYETFNVFLRGGNVVLQGVIKSGVAGTLFTLPANWRPVTDTVLTALASTGGGVNKAIQLNIVAATGVVSISDLAATSGGTLSLHGVYWPIPYGAGVLV